MDNTKTIKFPTNKTAQPTEQDIKAAKQASAPKTAEEAITDILANKQYLLIDLNSGASVINAEKPISQLDIISVIDSVRLSYNYNLIKSTTYDTVKKLLKEANGNPNAATAGTTDTKA